MTFKDNPELGICTIEHKNHHGVIGRHFFSSCTTNISSVIVNKFRLQMREICKLQSRIYNVACLARHGRWYVSQIDKSLRPQQDLERLPYLRPVVRLTNTSATLHR